MKNLYANIVEGKVVQESVEAHPASEIQQKPIPQGYVPVLAVSAAGVAALRHKLSVEYGHNPRSQRTFMLQFALRELGLEP